MEDNFRRPQRTLNDDFDYRYHFDLGPPIMRGAIVFSGSSHPTLVDGICDRLGSKRGSASLGKFANGETSVSIRAFAFVNCT
jgi:ribose-phosphate pyrophosphokinase